MNPKKEGRPEERPPEETVNNMIQEIGRPPSLCGNRDRTPGRRVRRMERSVTARYRAEMRFVSEPCPLVARKRASQEKPSTDPAARRGPDLIDPMDTKKPRKVYISLPRRQADSCGAGYPATRFLTAR